jgi:hypothetical protein
MNDPMTPSTGSTPQFATAEYKSPDGAEICKSCGKGISGHYFRINGALACESCISQLKSQIPVDTHPAFVRGVLFGIGGAIVGLILYATFGIVTGLEIGYLSLAVGYIVGKAIRMGSRGLGGRRYQIAAVALTYFAVSMSAVPIGIHQYIKARQEKTRPSDTSANRSADANHDARSQQSSGYSANPEAPAPNALKVIAMLVGYGLASPFLELENPVNGALGIIILIVGIRLAWSLTGAPNIDILGPFRAASPVAPQPGS